MQKLTSNETQIEQAKQVKSRINKEYFEYYAKYSMIRSLDNQYSYLIKDESPDWQSEDLDVGVEVTRAIDKDIYLAHNIINEYFGNVFMSNHTAEKVKERQQEYSDLKNTAESSVDYTDIFNIANLQKRYLHKTVKLNTNYAHYHQNLLYMFTFKSMDESEVRQCFDINLSKFKVNFDFCIVNCFDRLYICDFVKKEILNTVHVDADDLKTIKKKALRKSHLM